MRTLLLKFFLSFWLIIVMTIGAGAAAGYWYAERLREALESFEIDDSLLAASQALQGGGRQGLERWLRDSASAGGITIFVLDDEGRELLDRRLPYAVMRSFRRHREHLHENRRPSGGPPNLRRSRPHPQLLASDGSVYTLLASPTRLPQWLWTRGDARLLLFLFAVMISAAVSYALAAAISRPVRKLRHATLKLAGGDLETRVADAVGRRHDELGLLSRDFDRMAENLQRAAAQQAELSRNISHELRSPLARMRVAVELARGTNGDLPEFAKLDEEAERLDTLIGQILSFTRLEADPQHSAASFDLGDVVNEVVDNVNYECRAEGIDGITVKAKVAETPTFFGHREALVSALENVLRNAVRHSPAHTAVQVDVDCGESGVRIVIRDRGPGVDPDDLPRLFEPFFRASSADGSPAATGTGLGLAIADRAVRLNGGTLSAENHADGGLAVVVFLPR